jgi:uncharacterized membrane protein YhiD involved in acid resistance
MLLTKIVIIATSVLFQLVAAFLAVKLIGITRKKTAWLLIAAAISLMTVRRIESLALMISGDLRTSPDVLFEVTGLVISCFMLAGIYLIQPLFSSMARSEEELQKMNAKLSTLSEDQQNLIAELQGALARIKTLRGMLPICASCKKVRDDKGYWSQIEAYISEHSEAEFSHGLCPECAQKLYPTYYTQEMSKKE